MIWGSVESMCPPFTIVANTGSGSYIHMVSTSGLIGNLGQANYSAAKLGLVALSIPVHSRLLLDSLNDGLRQIDRSIHRCQSRGVLRAALGRGPATLATEYSTAFDAHPVTVAEIARVILGVSHPGTIVETHSHFDALAAVTVLFDFVTYQCATSRADNGRSRVAAATTDLMAKYAADDATDDGTTA